MIIKRKADPGGLTLLGLLSAGFQKDDWTAAVPAGFDLVVSLQACTSSPCEPHPEALRAALQPARSGGVF